MQMVRDILMYMDRTFVSFNKKMPVYEMGLVVFRDTVARHEKVKGRLQALILQVMMGMTPGAFLRDRFLFRFFLCVCLLFLFLFGFT